MLRYVMSLDQGTTSCRCILFDHRGEVCAMAQEEFSQIYPRPGWVEHDPMEIWRIQLKVARLAMARLGVTADQVAGIGITNQRETTVVWNRRTGEPVYPAIVWQCRRTADEVSRLVDSGQAPFIAEKTGLVPDAYSRATKIRWNLDNQPGARESAERGELLFGTIDSWLVWNLTGGRVHVTDYTNASRTMLFNIHTLDWDDDLLRLFSIPRSMLPEVRDSSCRYGESTPDLFGAPIPVCGIAGDQQASLFGQCCWNPGDVKNTYGTGCFLLMNTGDRPVRSRSGLLTTIAAGLEGRVTYALEGGIFVGGAVVQWLRDELKLIDDSADSEYFSRKVADTGGVYMVPAFIGLGAPYWKPYARGCLVGMTRGTSKAQIVRAALESIAYQTVDLCRAMEQDTGTSLKALMVDGGASRNNFLMQFQSDVLDAEIARCTCVETTALGAAYLAGLAVGYWEDRADILANRVVATRYSPAISPQQRQSLLEGWNMAIRCAIAWGEMQHGQ